jgi:hypothetical protein
LARPASQLGPPSPNIRAELLPCQRAAVHRGNCNRATSGSARHGREPPSRQLQRKPRLASSCLASPPRSEAAAERTGRGTRSRPLCLKWRRPIMGAQSPHSGNKTVPPTLAAGPSSSHTRTRLRHHRLGPPHAAATPRQRLQRPTASRRGPRPHLSHGQAEKAKRGGVRQQITAWISGQGAADGLMRMLRDY